MVERVIARWGVWVEHPDGRKYWMGDSRLTQWSRETAEGVAAYMNDATMSHEAGTYVAKSLTELPPEPKYGVWDDSENRFVVDAHNETLWFATRNEAIVQAIEWNDDDAEDWVARTGRGCYEARKKPQD